MGASLLCGGNKLLPSLHTGNGLAQHLEPGAGADRLSRENLPESSRAGSASKQAVQVPSVVVQAVAALKPPRNRGHEGFDRLEPVGDRRGLVEQLRIDADQELGVLIGRATEHDSIELLKMRP